MAFKYNKISASGTSLQSHASQEEEKPLSSSPLDKPKQHILHLENEGRLTLPKSVQKRLNLQPGSRLILKIGEDNTLQIVTSSEN